MHEWSLATALLEQVQALAAEHGCSHVLRVQVRIGAFSGIQDELLASAYEQLICGTLLNGSKLEIDSVPLVAECEACGHAFEVERFRFECPKCGAGTITVQSGEELLLESITME